MSHESPKELSEGLQLLINIKMKRFTRFKYLEKGHYIWHGKGTGHHKVLKYAGEYVIIRVCFAAPGPSQLAIAERETDSQVYQKTSLENARMSAHQLRSCKFYDAAGQL